MVRIIDENVGPTTAERFGRAFSNLGQAAATEIPDFMVKREQSKQLAKALGLSPEEETGFGKLSPEYQKLYLSHRGQQAKTLDAHLKYAHQQLSKTLDPYSNKEEFDRVWPRVQALIQQGVDPYQALSMGAAEEEEPEQGRLRNEAEPKERAKDIARVLKGPNREGRPFAGTIGSKGKEFAKGFGREPAKGVENFNPHADIAQMPTKELLDLSEDQVAQLPKDQQEKYFMRVQGEALGQGVGAFVEGVLPFGGKALVNKAKEKGLIAEQDLLGPSGQAVGKIAGEIGSPISKMILPFKIGSAAEKLAKNGYKFLSKITGTAVTGAALEGMDIYTQTGETPTPESLGKSLLTYAGLEAGLGLLKGLGRFEKNLKEYTRYGNVEVLPAEAEAAGAGTATREIEGGAYKQLEQQAPKEATFTTSKGSTYTLHPDGTTTRNKAARPEHPDPREQGLMPRSAKTYFVRPEDVNKLSEIQAQNAPAMEIAELPDGSIAIKYLDGKYAGKFSQNSVVKPEKGPKEGLMPVEIWEDGQVHFGNKITKVEGNATPAPSQQVLKNTLQQAQAEGVNLEKVAAGDAAEAKKVSDILQRNVEIVKATSKGVYNPHYSEKERALMMKLLPESPLEVYFEPEKVTEHRPETIAKQEAITKELTPVREKLYQDIAMNQDQLRKLQYDANRAAGQAKERIQGLIEYKNRQIEDIRNQLRDVNFELKHFQKRETPEEIAARVQKAADEFRAEARSPTEEGQRKIARKIELDQKFIERSEKILERGELPGDVSPDTFMRIKKQYADGYRALIEREQELLKELRGLKDKENLRQAAESKKFIELLKNRLKRLDADVANQADKIRAMRALEKPSGAFYKHQLKTIRKDIADFQKDYFKAPHVKSPVQLKTQSAMRQKIKDIKDLADRLKAEPTPENIEQLAEEAGVTNEEFERIFGKREAKAPPSASGERVELGEQPVAEEAAAPKEEPKVSEEELRKQAKENWDKLNKKAEEKAKDPAQKFAFKKLKDAWKGISKSRRVIYFLFGPLVPTTLPGAYNVVKKQVDLHAFKKAYEDKDMKEVYAIRKRLIDGGMSKVAVKKLEKEALRKLKKR